MAEAWQKDMMKDGKSEDAIRPAVSQSKQRFDSPVLLLACLTMEEMDCYLTRQTKLMSILSTKFGGIFTDFLLVFGQGFSVGFGPFFCSRRKCGTADIISVLGHWDTPQCRCSPAERLMRFNRQVGGGSF